MGKQVLLLALSFLLLMPLCTDPAKEGTYRTEQIFLFSIKEHNQTKVDLKTAIDSRDYTEILRAISRYNESLRRLSTSTVELCLDKNMRKKYSETCSRNVLLNRCNTRDIECTALAMRLIHDPAMTKDECDRLLLLTGEQEECRILDQSYVPTKKDREAVETLCSEL
jgi:hypothetical protein